MRRKPRESRKGVWFSAFLVAILVFSVGGYIFGSSPQKMEYNDYSFVAAQGGFILEVGGYPIAFTYFPDQLEGLYFPADAKSLLQGRPMIYITYDPNSSLAQDIASSQFRMQSVLPETAGIYVQPALTAETNFSLPRIDCSNATVFVPVVVFEESNVTNATVEKGCLRIYAAERRDVVAYSERIIYSLLGVME